MSLSCYQSQYEHCEGKEKPQEEIQQQRTCQPDIKSMFSNLEQNELTEDCWQVLAEDGIYTEK